MINYLIVFLIGYAVGYLHSKLHRFNLDVAAATRHHNDAHDEIKARQEACGRDGHNWSYMVESADVDENGNYHNIEKIDLCSRCFHVQPHIPRRETETE